METKLKQLTWKYFWKQKGWEVGITLGIIFCLLFLPWIIGDTSCRVNQKVTETWIGTNTQDINSDVKCFNGFWITYTIGWLMFLLLIIILVALFVVGWFIWKWIESNWDKAKQRARGEIKFGNKQRS